jgi:hypothetical protein
MLGTAMSQLSVMLGLMIVVAAAIGGLLYVALVIAIPVCRMLDWLSPAPTDERPG